MSLKTTEDQTELERFCKKLETAIKKQVSETYEKVTLEVRPGVTWIDIEIFLGDRVTAVSLERIKAIDERGTYDIYARGIIERLRSKYVLTRQDSNYRRLDVLREIYHQLESVVQKCVSPTDWRDILSRVKSQVRLVLPEEDLEDVSGIGPSAAHLKLLIEFFSQIIQEGFSFKREDLGARYDDGQPPRKKRGRPRKQERPEGEEEEE